jgi:hypothetical protein
LSNTFWIVFTDSNHWTKRYLRPHFAHCYVVTRDDYNWLVINPEQYFLRTEIAPIPADQDLITMIVKPQESVIKVDFLPRYKEKHLGRFGLINCVSMTQYIIGTRIACLTPYGLFKSLLTLTKDRQDELRIDSISLIKDGTK